MAGGGRKERKKITAQGGDSPTINRKRKGKKKKKGAEGDGDMSATKRGKRWISLAGRSSRGRKKKKGFPEEKKKKGKGRRPKKKEGAAAKRRLKSFRKRVPSGGNRATPRGPAEGRGKKSHEASRCQGGRAQKKREGKKENFLKKK